MIKAGLKKAAGDSCESSETHHLMDGVIAAELAAGFSAVDIYILALVAVDR